MSKKKRFFEKVDNQRAMLIASIIALILVVIDALRVATRLIVPLFGVRGELIYVCEFAVAVIIIGLFIKKYEHLLHD